MDENPDITIDDLSKKSRHSTFSREETASAMDRKKDISKGAKQTTAGMFLPLKASDKLSTNVKLTFKGGCKPPLKVI